MTKDQLLSQISELRGALALVESDLKTQVPGPRVLDEFRSIVDSTRKSVWTVLNAMAEEDYEQFVADFRVRRATDLVTTAMKDLAMGATVEHRDVEALRATLENVVNSGGLTPISEEHSS